MTAEAIDAAQAALAVAQQASKAEIGNQGAEGTRRGAVGERSVPEARHQRCDVLQIAVALWTEISDVRKLKALKEEELGSNLPRSAAIAADTEADPVAEGCAYLRGQWKGCVLSNGHPTPAVPWPVACGVPAVVRRNLLARSNPDPRWPSSGRRVQCERGIGTGARRQRIRPDFPRCDHGNNGYEPVWRQRPAMPQVGKAEHIKMFANVDATEKWFEEEKPEGVPFEYQRNQQPARCPLSSASLELRGWFLPALLSATKHQLSDPIMLNLALRSNRALNENSEIGTTGSKPHG